MFRWIECFVLGVGSLYTELYRLVAAAVPLVTRYFNATWSLKTYLKLFDHSFHAAFLIKEFSYIIS